MLQTQERERMNPIAVDPAVALRGFFAIAQAWGLNTEDARALLGAPPTGSATSPASSRRWRSSTRIRMWRMAGSGDPIGLSVAKRPCNACEPATSRILWQYGVISTQLAHPGVEPWPSYAWIDVRRGASSRRDTHPSTCLMLLSGIPLLPWSSSPIRGSAMRWATLRSSRPRSGSAGLVQATSWPPLRTSIPKDRASVTAATVSIPRPRRSRPRLRKPCSILSSSHETARTRPAVKTCASSWGPCPRTSRISPHCRQNSDGRFLILRRAQRPRLTRNG